MEGTATEEQGKDFGAEVVVCLGPVGISPLASRGGLMTLSQQCDRWVEILFTKPEFTNLSPSQLPVRQPAWLRWRSLNHAFQQSLGNIAYILHLEHQLAALSCR